METNPKSELADAERTLQRLQEEHRPILDQLNADPGMSESTRKLLTEHLEEEEQEHAERIAELRAQAGSSAQPRSTGRRAPSASAATVGSLRPTGSGAPAARGSVGSLRPQ